MSDENFELPPLPDSLKQAIGGDTSSEDSQKEPTFEEMGAAFDKQFEVLKSALQNMSKKSLIRVFLKNIAYPLKDDQIMLIQKEEIPIYELSANISQLKINMMIASLTKMHQEYTEEMVENLKNDPTKVEDLKESVDQLTKKGEE